MVRGIEFNLSFLGLIVKPSLFLSLNLVCEQLGKAFLPLQGQRLFAELLECSLPDKCGLVFLVRVRWLICFSDAILMSTFNFGRRVSTFF